MTRSKLEFAKILVSLRGSDEDPQKLANEMTLRKLCYEIEKAEEAKEAAAAPPPPPKNILKSLWGILTLEDTDSS